MKVELRWYVCRNKTPNAREVSAYRDNYGTTMTQAKAALLEETTPKLQYRYADGMGGYSTWVDVPLMIEERS